MFQSTVRNNAKVKSNLKNLLDVYNIRPFQKSMFGHFADNIKFFCQSKNQDYKYIFDEV